MFTPSSKADFFCYKTVKERLQEISTLYTFTPLINHSQQKIKKMKTIQIMLIMGVVINIVTTDATAQLAMNSRFTSGTEGDTAENKSTAKLNRASFRAFNDFKSAFKNEPDAKWYVETDVITAAFTKDDIRTKVVYDKKGRWLRTMRVYQENKMPEDIRSLVKRSIYYDYTITLVHQIQEGDITFYIVGLKNGKKFKQISVYDGEINVFEEFDLQG